MSFSSLCDPADVHWTLAGFVLGCVRPTAIPVCVTMTSFELDRTALPASQASPAVITEHEGAVTVPSSAYEAARTPLTAEEDVVRSEPGIVPRLLASAVDAAAVDCRSECSLLSLPSLPSTAPVDVASSISLATLA